MNRPELNTYNQTIANYQFQVIELPSGYISFCAPTGTTAGEKEMFDTLVYYHTALYSGKTIHKQKIVQAIGAWIEMYKEKQRDNFI